MTYDEFTACASFKTIINSYGAPRDEAAKRALEGYVQLIYAATSEWRAQTFDTACKGVIKTMGRGQRPMPEDFKRALNTGVGENLPGADGCDSCSKTGWIYVNMMRTSDGFTAKHVIPCHNCRPRHPYRDARPKAGWVIVE